MDFLDGTFWTNSSRETGMRPFFSMHPSLHVARAVSVYQWICWNLAGRIISERMPDWIHIWASWVASAPVDWEQYGSGSCQAGFAGVHAGLRFRTSNRTFLEPEAEYGVGRPTALGQVSSTGLNLGLSWML